jgi:hypothetical protein
MPAAAVNTVMLPVAYTKGATLKRADRRPAHEVTFWDAWGRQEG